MALWSCLVLACEYQLLKCSGILQAGWWHMGILKLAMVGTFTPRKLANGIN
jgi:hypothetical protein